jgi:hypothetical protein
VPDTPTARGEHRAAPPWRRRTWWSLLVAVALAHLLLGDRLSAEFISLADSGRPAMQRMQASYTRMLEQSVPTPPAARPPRRLRKAVAGAAPPAAAASAAKAQAPDLAAAGATSAAEPASAADEAAQAAASVASAVAAVTAVTAASVDVAAAASAIEPGRAATTPAGTNAAAASATGAASSSPGSGSTAALAAAARQQPAASSPAGAATNGASRPFAAASAPALGASAVTAGVSQNLDGVDWPASTRLSYELHGWYRGDVTGSAKVEWLRDGRRYQVHLEVVIGSSMAPLARRRMSSEGRISADGLVPQRYEQETTQIIGRTRRADMVLGSDMVTLANGQRQPRPPDVQDTASQFVQMVFLLMTRPELARPGASVEFALAMPHRIDRWTYDMIGAETLATPAGAISTLHVRPRRPAAEGDLTVQMWLAPSLQMLPARIRIEQDATTWADLVLAKAPEQAAR